MDAFMKKILWFLKTTANEALNEKTKWSQEICNHTCASLQTPFAQALAAGLLTSVPAEHVYDPQFTAMQHCAHHEPKDWLLELD
jgi:hypothetical protein